MSATGRPMYLAGAGTSLKYGTLGGTPATPMPSLRKFSNLPSAKVDSFETTQIDAVLTDGTTPDMAKYKEFGKVDYGDMAFVIGGDATAWATVESLLGVNSEWLLTFSDTSTYQFPGAISSRQITVNENGEATLTITVTLSGPSTFTPVGGDS